MNENVRMFLCPEMGSQVLEKNQLLALAERLVPQGASEKVKKHLEIVAGMTDTIRGDGFELLIRETLNKEGTAGRIEINLTSADWADIDTPFIEEDFNNERNDYFNVYPDASAIRSSYILARENARARVGGQAIHMMKEGKLSFSENITSSGEKSQAEAAAA